jgi:hypothetical protein
VHFNKISKTPFDSHLDEVSVIDPDRLFYQGFFVAKPHRASVAPCPSPAERGDLPNLLRLPAILTVFLLSLFALLR